MTDQPPDHSNGESGTPRWVKVGAVIAIAVLLAFVILMLSGGGQHGPSRHVPGGNHPTSPVQDR